MAHRRGSVDEARAAAREDTVNIGSRTGLTTVQIDFMKQLYSREPDEYGASTLDMMKRTATPQLSTRMAAELGDLRQGGAHRSAAEMVDAKQSRVRRVVAPASARRLVGGLHLRRGVTMHGEPALAPGSSRGHDGGSTARSLGQALAASPGTGRSSVTIGASTARSQRSAASTARSSSSSSSSSSCCGTARQGGGFSARSSSRSTARAAAAAEELGLLAQQREELSQQLTALQASLDEAGRTPEEYDAQTGYEVYKSRMYLTNAAKDYTGKRPAVPERREFARKGTQHSRYANQLALSKNTKVHGGTW